MASAEHYVVGSGPSGVAVASALLDAGVPVTMLDAGQECEPERLEIARRMSVRQPDEWSAQDVDAIRDRRRAGTAPFPVKLAYGSAFPYAADARRFVRQIGTRCLESHARGGLSNVWGAAVLPTRASDSVDWPFAIDELAPHYRAAAELMPIAGATDELARILPFYAPPRAPLRSSRLADMLLARMRASAATLEDQGILFGRSRLAVRSEPDEAATGCQYVGLCLSGCPYFAIWNAAAVLDKVKRRADFVYRPGMIVERVESTHAGRRIRVHAREAAGATRTFDGHRVFLACGPLATSRIILDSLEAPGTVVTLQYQPYFLLPFLCAADAGDVEHERLHTLSQLFLEIEDRSISSSTVHLQLYTYNEFIRDRVSSATAWLGPLQPMMSRRALGRLAVVQGYLHSREAAPILVSTAIESRGGASVMTLRAQPAPGVRAIVKRCIRKLASHARALGARPLGPLCRIGIPGDGNHVGGVFRMSRSPSALETDTLGQLSALPRVHLVDSTSLPSLAATTLTYTVMANAHRIGCAVAAIE